MARGIPAKRREGHAVAGVPVQVAVRCYSDPAVYTVRPVSQSIVSASPKPTRTVAHPPARANASASDVAAATRRPSSSEPAGAVPTSNAPPSPPDSYSMLALI